MTGTLCSVGKRFSLIGDNFLDTMLREKTPIAWASLVSIYANFAGKLVFKKALDYAGSSCPRRQVSGQS